MDGFIGLAALGIAILLFVGANIVAVAFMMTGPGADAVGSPGMSTHGVTGAHDRGR